ncbi:MAG: hypothetical protein DYG90_02045 [Chloroflexi bacterium CFX6]|nr:hypothetical protein [Chloroflexi bacterium CFX6]
MSVALWCASFALGVLHSYSGITGIPKLLTVPSAHAQGPTCLVGMGTTFESDTAEGWTTTNVNGSLSSIQPGGPPPSHFFYQLRDASGPSTLDAPASYLGDLTAGLNQGCDRWLCYDVNLLDDGQDGISPDFLANFTVYGTSGGQQVSAQFVSTVSISEPTGMHGGWHHVCAPIKLIGLNDPLPTGWKYNGATSAWWGAWNDLMNHVDAIKFPVDWNNDATQEVVGYDNFCVSDNCDCVTFGPPDVSCQYGPAGSSGCYTVSVSITNHTGAPVTHVLASAPAGAGTVTPNVIIPLPAPLNPGLTTGITVVLCPPAGATSGLINIGLVGIGGGSCCRKQLSFDLPKCEPAACLWVPKYTVTCVPGAPPGTFDLSFGLKNMMSCGAGLYLVPQSPASVSPAYFAGPYPPNASDPNFVGFVGTIHVTGATSSLFCMDVFEQCIDPVSCCGRRLCFAVPNCWPNPMPPPTPNNTLQTAPGAPLDAAKGR